MSGSNTHKGKRDQFLSEHWDSRSDADFDRFQLSREQLKAAQSQLRGHIVLPGDPTYDQNRKLSNVVFDTFPSMIIYCHVESDVAVALQLARQSALGFTVRSGGHCTAGFSASSGILIDVSSLNEVQVDSTALIASAACGCQFGKLTEALQAQGMHVPVGECMNVCVGGYVQGGGYGFTSVTFGMNCDNVIDMRVMLADGAIVTASPNVNYDLWWAMRGGTGGTFGVLLSVRYQLRPLGEVFGWALIWPLDTDQGVEHATGAMLALQADYMRRGSPQMTIQVSLSFQPGTQGGLPLVNMQPFLLVRGLYVGSNEDGLAAIAPLRELPGAVTQWTKFTDFNTLNIELLNQPYGMPPFPPGTVWPCEDKTSRYVARDLAPAEWRAMLNYFKQTPNHYSYAYLEFYGGAINAYPRDDSAFIHRDCVFDIVLDVFWFDEAEKPVAVAYLEGWISLIEPMSNGHIYQNYPRPNEDNYAWKYWGEAHAGLYAVKLKYDPGNVFRFAQCVAAPEAGRETVLQPCLQAALERPIAYGPLRALS
ncbi:hypothetical protein AAKU55_001724 [Oxalobacteraceae bacterium GrIS 1.11]